MFVSPQISTVKHLWVDLHDEADRFVFWQYICHLRFMCQEVRCALGVFRWLISVLWDILPCLLYFKWQRMFFSAPAARIHIPFAIACIFLLSEGRNEFVAHIQRKRQGTERHVERESSILSHTLWSIWAAKGAKYAHSLFFTGPETHI